MNKNEEMTMEQAFDQLTALLSDMEQCDHSLEETFGLYTEGLKLVQYCNEKIDRIEKKLVVLEENEE